MTMYMTPYRRHYLRNLALNDRVARNLEIGNSEVHIPLDVKDEKDAFMLTAIIPGMNAEDIEINILKDTVSISGEFKNEDGEDESFLRRERPHGKFKRSLRFTSKLDAGKADAKLKHGILSLRIPKVAEAQPKNIKVKTS
jgi:HSP20 family protein